MDLAPKDAPICVEHKISMIRATGGSTSVLETLDNGAMPRSVERHRDIVELRHDHRMLTDTKEPGIV
jgi:hypothetical protein